MTDIISRLVSALGGAGREIDFIGPRQAGTGEAQGPILPIGGRAFNNAFALSPQALSALGFLGGGLTSFAGGGQQQAPNAGILEFLSQQPFQGVQSSQLTGASGLRPAQIGGTSNLGILQLLAGLGR